MGYNSLKLSNFFHLKSGYFTSTMIKIYTVFLFMKACVVQNHFNKMIFIHSFVYLCVYLSLYMIIYWYCTLCVYVCVSVCNQM